MINLKLCLIVLIFCNIHTLHAQNENIDSLVSALKDLKDEDTIKIDVLNQLCRKNTSHGNYKEGIIYANNALKLAKQLNYPKGLAGSYNSIGYVYGNQGKFDLALSLHNTSLMICNKYTLVGQKILTLNDIATIYIYKGEDILALDFLNQSLKLCIQIGDKKGEAKANGNISILQINQGDYITALEFSMKALKYFEGVQDTIAIGKSYQNIGNIYAGLTNHTFALKYYQKALLLFELINSKAGMAQLNGNIGLIYRREHNYDKALHHLKLCQQLSAEINDVNTLKMVYSNIAKILIDKKMFSTAIENYHKSLDIVRKLQDNHSIMIVYTALGEVFNEMKISDSALYYFDQSLKLSAAAGFKPQTMSNHLGLSIAYENDSNYSKALINHKKYSEINDSIYVEKTHQQISDMEAKYENDIKTEEIEKLSIQERLQQKEIETQSFYIYLMLIAIGTFILIVIFGFVILLTKRKAERARRNLDIAKLEMKSLRSQMNPHFIFNSLQSIQNFLISNKSEDANEYLLKFSKLMRLVLENSMQQEVPLKDDILALDLYMQLEQLRFTRPFSYEIMVEDSVNPEVDSIPPLLLQPFVENSIWHGLQYKSDSGKIMIRFKKEKEALICVVEDNGVGRSFSKKLKEPVFNKESLGIKLTEERISLLHKVHGVEAKLSVVDLFSSENKPSGTRVEVYLPMAG